MIDTEIKSKLYDLIENDVDDRSMQSWHASDLARCPRALYLMRSGQPSLSQPGAGKKLRWKAGFAFEDVIRPYLKKLYPLLMSNRRLTAEVWDLTGEYDNYDKVTKTIFEVKTVHDYAFKDGPDGTLYLKEADGKNDRGQNAWKPKETPYLHHEIQNHAYVLLLNEQNLEVDNIVYVYLSLSGRMAVYNTKVNPEYLAAVKRRLDVLGDAWSTQTLPDCVCKEGEPLWSEVNQYCPYQDDGECCKQLVKETV